jgi:hypothetical protein
MNGNAQLAFALIGVAILAAQPTSSRKTKSARNKTRNHLDVERSLTTPSAAILIPEAPPLDTEALSSATDCGLALHRNGIEIVSWDLWMGYAPGRFVAAIQRGLGSPEEILGFVFQEIWPALRWPPAEGSPYREAWDRLVVRVDQSLPRVATDGRPRLRII